MSGERLKQLEDENRALNEQMKRLIRTEHRLSMSQQALDRQLERVEALNHFTLKHARNESIDQILSRATDMLLDLFPFEQAVAYLKSGNGELIPMVSRGLNGIPAPILQAKNLPREAVFGTSSDCVAAQPELLGLLEKLGYMPDAAMLSLPVAYEAETEFYGLLLLRRKTPELSLLEHLPAAEDLPFLRLIIDHIASAFQDVLYNKATLDSERQAQWVMKWTTELAEASRVLAKLDYQEVLNTTARRASHFLCCLCMIRMLSPDFHHLSLKAVCNSNPAIKQDLKSELLNKAASINDKPYAQAFGTQDAVVVKNERMELLVVPMRFGGSAIGVMELVFYGNHVLHPNTGFLQNLADRAAQAVENARLYREAQDAIQARNEFLSIASHELRTPITPLKNELQLIHFLIKTNRLHTYPQEHLEKLVTIADRELVRLSRLVDGMLDVTRITSGRLVLKFEEVDLAKLIEEMLDRLQTDIERAGSMILLDLKDTAHGVWDRLRIEQVIINLLSNALKYGKGKPIVLSTRTEGEKAIITVKDHGIGIPADELSMVFKRFARALSATSFSGLGLGLYIARQIVESHNGSIRVTSEVGVGSVFTVELPLRVAAEKTQEKAA